ncbi:ABC transporter permease [Paenibacillus solisilvae]|uniref:ABC transporter permease n=1 Tax=Paenibacillus solisilvae TaxID=2486751 RepID=A0ABW0VVK5_9BACL
MWMDIFEVLSKPDVIQKIVEKTWQHLYLSLISMALAIGFAVPAGILLSRTKRVAEWLMNVVGMLQTIPSLALLAFMIPIMGIGTTPTLAALFLYAILPILRSTYTGIRSVDPVLIESGKGMGMTSMQLLLKVQIPLSLPIMMNGIRISTVMIIGWATLGAYIGAGGLGDLIMAGFATLTNGYIIAGAIPVTLLALLADTLLGMFEKRWTVPSQRGGIPS